MGRVHFVGRRGASPLCGAAERHGWIETERTDAVTCERCLSHLEGARVPSSGNDQRHADAPDTGR